MGSPTPSAVGGPSWRSWAGDTACSGSICQVVAYQDARTRATAWIGKRSWLQAGSITSAFRAAIENLRPDLVLPTKREELARQIRRSLAGGSDLAQALDDGSVSIEAFNEEVRVGKDHRKQVVEVVGNADRKATHRFHLLRMPKLLIELALKFGGRVGATWRASGGRNASTHEL